MKEEASIVTIPAESTALKCCGAQHLQSLPSYKWTAEQLTDFSRECSLAIDTAERSMAVLYWRLGFALQVARKRFKHGSWQGFLKGAGINPTRASKAVAIRLAFSTEEQIRELTVKKAYEKRRRKIATRRTKPRREGKAAVANTDRVNETLDRYLLQVESLPITTLPRVTSTEAAALLPRINLLIDQLIRFRDDMDGLVRDDFLLDHDVPTLK